MKVIAFGASTSSTSINKALATYAASLIEGADVEVLDLTQFDVPLFSEDKEKEIGQAEGAKAFLEAIQQADALVISFAEHNGHHPAATKTYSIGRRELTARCSKGFQHCILRHHQDQVAPRMS